jgi:predicted transcriptional regulator
VVHAFRERIFSSDDVRRHYHQLYVEPIPLTTVATYLSRLVDRGLLHRTGSPRRWRYSLAERLPNVRVE